MIADEVFMSTARYLGFGYLALVTLIVFDRNGGVSWSSGIGYGLWAMCYGFLGSWIGITFCLCGAFSTFDLAAVIRHREIALKSIRQMKSKT